MCRVRVGVRGVGLGVRGVGVRGVRVRVCDRVPVCMCL